MDALWSRGVWVGAEGRCTSCREQAAILNEPLSPKPKTMRVRISRESMQLPSALPRVEGGCGAEQRHSQETSCPRQGSGLPLPGQREGWLPGDEGKHEGMAAPLSEFPPSPATPGCT